jgi:hypothetical protein
MTFKYKNLFVQIDQGVNFYDAVIRYTSDELSPSLAQNFYSIREIDLEGVVLRCKQIIDEDKTHAPRLR